MFQAHGIQSQGGYNQNQGPHHSHHGEQNLHHGKHDHSFVDQNPHHGDHYNHYQPLRSSWWWSWFLQGWRTS